ncbi:MAG: metallophosphoesterase family protein [Burkholderiales bacterium]
MPEGPGRGCPIAYHYGARSLAVPATLHVDTLWVAGGLYGNPEALERLLELYADEKGDKALVFNGDFHWFDVVREDFLRVNDSVLAHPATRGNVETELALPGPGAGCGCGYPAWVGDAEVARSNRIIERLRATAALEPRTLRALAALPMHLVAEVGGERVAVVHGDADSLAGWSFSQETLATEEGLRAARAAFVQAHVRVFASSHTCLPVLQAIGEAAIVNNGAAGMPNFRGTRFGLATRISVRPRPSALYAMRAGKLEVEARPIHYDHTAWCARFLASWPEGSDAHASYFSRILNGPNYQQAVALRADPAAATRQAA